MGFARSAPFFVATRDRRESPRSGPAGARMRLRATEGRGHRQETQADPARGAKRSRLRLIRTVSRAGGHSKAPHSIPKAFPIQKPAWKPAEAWIGKCPASLWF